MAMRDPVFRGFTFSTANVIVKELTATTMRDAEIATAASIEAAVSSAAKDAGRRVTMSCQVTGTTENNTRDNFGQWLYKTRDRGDLHIYSDRYLWCQRVSETDLNIKEGSGGYVSDFTTEFLADNPYWIANSAISFNQTYSTSVSFTVNYAGSAPTFAGTAPKIPMIVTLTANTTTIPAGSTFTINNTTTGDKFRYRTAANILNTAKLIIDGRSKEVTESSSYKVAGMSGAWPALQGGVSNSFLITGPSIATVPTLNFVIFDLYD